MGLHQLGGSRAPKYVRMALVRTIAEQRVIANIQDNLCFRGTVERARVFEQVNVYEFW